MPHPVDIHVGKRLRMQRTLLGLTQIELASETGITFQQIQKYERGANRVSASRLFQFSNILEVPISFFFGEFNNSDEPEISNDLTADDLIFSHRETLELMRAYNSIKDSKVRKGALALIQAIAVQEP